MKYLQTHERVETVEQDECVDIEKEEISPNL